MAGHIHAPTQIQLEQFFTQCGEFMFHEIRTSGEAPNRTFISYFHYDKGHASFNGKVWNIFWD